jgi:hypothetical protein
MNTKKVKIKSIILILIPAYSNTLKKTDRQDFNLKLKYERTDENTSFAFAFFYLILQTKIYSVAALSFDSISAAFSPSPDLTLLLLLLIPLLHLSRAKFAL